MAAYKYRGGRPPGSKNKTKAYEVAAKLRQLDYDLVAEILKDMPELTPVQRVHFHMKLLEFVAPKKKDITITGDFEAIDVTPTNVEEIRERARLRLTGT